MFVKKLGYIQQNASETHLNPLIKLQAINHCVDPHGRIICLYSDHNDKLYIISILAILSYIRHYRQQFAKHLSYSFNRGIIPDSIIQNTIPHSNILLIKLTQQIQCTQFLVVSYYPATVLMYSVLNGNIIHRIKIDETPIMDVNTIGHSLYLTLYTSQMVCFEGNELRYCCYQKQKKRNKNLLKLETQKSYPRELMRLTYSQIDKKVGHKSDKKGKGQSNSEQSEQEEKPTQKQIRKKGKEGSQKKIVPVYQTIEGDLMIHNDIIMKFQENSVNKQQIKEEIEVEKPNRKKIEEKQQRLENSLDQYMRLQLEKYSDEILTKYQISLCTRFIVCRKSDRFELLYRGRERIVKYSGKRKRIKEWGSVWEGKSKPVVNHFWDGDSKSQVLIGVIGSYVEEERTVLKKETSVSIIGINVEDKTKKEDSKKIECENQFCQARLVCQLKELKHEIIEISWIGPNHLLLKDIKYYLYYMQIDFSQL